MREGSLPSREAAVGELARYSTHATQISQRRDSWSTLRVDIPRDGEVIGSCERDYPSLLGTFHPFIGPDGATYARYSPHYTGTRLMRLPGCVDIGGEPPSDEGFCPADYFAPFDPARGLDGTIGFVAGCIWGDDSSWKVRFVDLLRVTEGRLAVDERFGYLELPDDRSLEQAIDLRDWRLDNREVRIHAVHPFEIDLRDGETDPSVIVDERPPDAGLVVPAADLPRGFDSYHATFEEPGLGTRRSQPVESFGDALAIAVRRARERAVKTSVWGVRTGDAREERRCCTIEPDGTVEMWTTRW